MHLNFFVRNWLAFFVVILVAESGCHANRFKIKEPRIDTIDEAGSVRVSVVSVAEWSDYVDSLMPGFTLSANDALSKVIPDTRLIDERRLQASRTEVKVAFSGLAAGAVPGEHVETPGTTEGLDTSGSAAGGRTAATMTPIAALEKADLDGSDPMAQYAAANGLYQEVRFLNGAVRDAAQREGYVPYVVRMNVGLMPRRRNLPYDVYVNLSLFTEGILNSVNQRPVDGTLDTPNVIPLLVTDSIEASMNSATLGRLIEASIALRGTTGTTEIGAKQGVTIEDLVRALGRDLNSLFMVSRLSDNTVRVRLGANQQVSLNHAMVPRNHTLTLLVLLPEPEAKANRRHIFQARSEMVHVRTGRTLSPKSNLRERVDLDQIARRFDLCDESESTLLNTKQPSPRRCLSSDRQNVLDEAFFAVIENEWESFAKVMNPIVPSKDRDALLQIWSELVTLNLGYYEDEIRFSVPAMGTGGFSEGQVVALLDDTKKVTVATVVGGKDIRNSRVCAALHFVDSVSGARKAIVADSVTVDGRREVVTLTYKSIQAIGLGGYASDAGKRIEIWLGYTAESGKRDDCWMDATVDNRPDTKKMATVYQAAVTPPSPAGFTLEWQPSHIVASNGTGPMRFEIEAMKGDSTAMKAVLEVSNATVISASATDAATAVSGKKIEVTLTPGKKTQVTIMLGNLDPSLGVGVKAENEKKVKQGDHSLRVLVQ